MKISTFFGGAMNITDSKEYLDTIEVGKILSLNGYHIKCGGYYGLMEAISKGSSQNGGTVTGYTCKTFPTTKGNKYLTETNICEHIFERLNKLIDESSLFIIQRGGLGTISELFLLLDIVRKKRDKPIIILIGEFWKDIINSIKILVPEKELECLKIITDIKEIKPYL